MKVVYETFAIKIYAFSKRIEYILLILYAITLSFRKYRNGRPQFLILNMSPFSIYVYYFHLTGTDVQICIN